MRSRWMLLAMTIAACDKGGTYTDADARAAMGARDDANPLHHDRYTDAECLGVVAGAGYAMGPHFSGSYADLTGAPDPGRLAGEVGGATFSEGCVDKSPAPPDCSACTTCLVGQSGYPATRNWSWLATFTPPSEGVLDLVIGSPVRCDRSRLTAPAELRLEVRLQERAGFPLPSDPASLGAGSATVSFDPGGGPEWARPDHDQPLHARLSTTSDDDPAGGLGILRPGVPVAVFVKAVPSAGVTDGACVLTRANVVLRFTPLLAGVDVTPG